MGINQIEPPGGSPSHFTTLHGVQWMTVDKVGTSLDVTSNRQHHVARVCNQQLPFPLKEFTSYNSNLGHQWAWKLSDHLTITQYRHLLRLMTPEKPSKTTFLCAPLQSVRYSAPKQVRNFFLDFCHFGEILDLFWGGNLLFCPLYILVNDFPSSELKLEQWYQIMDAVDWNLLPRPL